MIQWNRFFTANADGDKKKKKNTDYSYKLPAFKAIAVDRTFWVESRCIRYCDFL